MDRSTADAALSAAELIAFGEAIVPQAREMERRLLDGDIPVLLAKPPPKECCAGGVCGCGGKLQLLVREDDLPRVSKLLHDDWMEALRREGTVNPEALVQLNTPVAEGEPPCPACGFVGALKDGACSDCGLQLE